MFLSKLQIICGRFSLHRLDAPQEMEVMVDVLWSSLTLSDEIYAQTKKVLKLTKMHTIKINKQITFKVLRYLCQFELLLKGSSDAHFTQVDLII